MKQIKKSYLIYRLSFMLPLAGAMAVTMGFATPVYAGPPMQPGMFQQHLNLPAASRARPVKWPADLRVSVALDQSSIRKSNRRCVQGCAWDFTIRGSVKNIGRGDFIPKSPNAQKLQLMGPDPRNVSRSSLMQQWSFGRLNHGQTKHVSVHVQRQPGPATEFGADYTMSIVFGPDSPGDRNRRNNQMTLRRSTVMSAINHSHRITVKTKAKVRIPAFRH